MREGTAALAALVATRPARDVLQCIAAELAYRDRKPARLLASEIAALLTDFAPVFEVIPCLHGEVVPEAREVVVSVERVGAVEPAPAPKRQPAAKVPSARPLGDTPKQRAAFAALSPERQQHVRAMAAWREAWRAWRYFDGAEPGPAPVDTSSPEAIALIAREAAADAAPSTFGWRSIAAWKTAANAAPYVRREKNGALDPADAAKWAAFMSAARAAHLAS
jgi:hypothetical protein